MLPEATKEKMKWAVNRDGLASKQNDMLNWWKSISTFIDHKVMLIGTGVNALHWYTWVITPV